MTEREKILDKIKKCMALGASANEHEAAAALRQARKLMVAYGISDADVLASQAGEASAKAGAVSKPANWEAELAARIGTAFGCRVIFKSSGWVGRWTYIGCGAAPEVAQYVFDVLRRQALKARAEYIKTQLKRVQKAPTKTRRADLFSEGWVSTATASVQPWHGNDTEGPIEAHVAAHYPTLADLQSTDRNANRKLRDHEHNDYWNGRHAGRDAEVNRGVGVGAAPLVLE